MLLRWFDTRAAEDFGLGLAATYAEKYSNSTNAKATKVVTKQLRLTQETLVKAQKFNADHKLNLYQKAKMGNAFKWKLRELGYDNELIDALTKDLMVAMR